MAVPVTVSSPAKETEFTTNAGYLRGQISVSADEKQILLTNNSPGILSQIDLTTATDLTTASLTKTRNLGFGNLCGFKYYFSPKIGAVARDGGGDYYTLPYV